MNSAERKAPLPPLLFAPVAPSLLHEKQFYILLHKKHRTSSEKQSKSSKKEGKSLEIK